MFANISMTGVGAIITIVELVLKSFGIELPDGALAQGVNGVVTMLGILWLIWGHIRARQDLIVGVVRK